jgi:VWFA-related protein
MRSLLAGLTLFTALTLTAHAQVESVDVTQQMDAAQHATPTIQVYSRETIVDVLVTDNNGKPVTGLKRSDFTISEDDKPRPLRGFQETSKDPTPTPAPTLPPNTFTNAHAVPASGPVQIVYFILPCPPMDRGPAFIADYLRTMPAGTQVAVFGFRDDLGLRLIQGFTTDGPRAAAAIEHIELPLCKVPWADPIAAANQIAAYVAGIHGRKNLIWVGRPLSILRDGGFSWGSRADTATIHRLMDTYDRFTAEQIAIYPLDPGGVRAPAANIAGDMAINANTGAQFAAAQMSALTGVGRNNLFADAIAEATGGTAIYNTNDFKGAVAKVVADSTHYYTLAYVPPRAINDGHYHSIQIAVDRPGLHLNYRTGYNSEQPAPPDAVLQVHMTQDTMGLGSLPATQLVFNAKVEPEPANSPAKPTSTRKALALAGKTPLPYDVLFTLDPTQFSYQKSSDGTTTAVLEFDLVAYSTEAKVLAQRSQTMRLPLTPEEYQGFLQTPFQFFQAIDLPPGSLTLRMGVFDTISNRAGTLEIPLVVGKDSARPDSAATTP